MPPVPSAQSTVTCWVLDLFRVAVKVRFVEPLSPSVTLGELMETVTPSSLTIVPVPVAAEIVAFAALPSVTTTVSFGSSSVSPVTDTLKVWLVVPAAKVRLPPMMAV